MAKKRTKVWQNRNGGRWRTHYPVSQKTMKDNGPTFENGDIMCKVDLQLKRHSLTIPTLKSIYEERQRVLGRFRGQSPYDSLAGAVRAQQELARGGAVERDVLST